ncbi:unnamed protein product, partial [Ectocarpus sp. 12 AP-2014]
PVQKCFRARWVFGYNSNEKDGPRNRRVGYVLYLQHYPVLPSNFHRKHQLSHIPRFALPNRQHTRRPCNFSHIPLFLYVLEFSFYSSRVEYPSSSSSIHQPSPPPPGAPSRNSGADAVPLGRNPSTLMTALGWGYKT